MPRVARLDVGGYPYHVINRAVMRLPIFTSDEEYALFESVLTSAAHGIGMRVLAYCLMPNHWHLVLHPESDGDLGLFMHRLTNSHTRQVRSRTGTIGTGPLYQGRYKSFVIETDAHLLTVLKYVERNAVRASLAPRAEEWRWGSAWLRLHGSAQQRKLLSESPMPLPDDYQSWINTPEQSEELKDLRASVNKAAPYGRMSWVEKMIEQYGLESTQRYPGRPKK